MMLGVANRETAAAPAAAGIAITRARLEIVFFSNSLFIDSSVAKLTFTTSPVIASYNPARSTSTKRIYDQIRSPHHRSAHNSCHTDVACPRAIELPRGV